MGQLTTNGMQILYATLANRHRPVDIARLALAHDIGLSDAAKQALKPAAAAHNYQTLMAEAFAAPVSLVPLAQKLEQLIGVTVRGVAAGEADAMHRLLNATRMVLGMPSDSTRLAGRRFNRDERNLAGTLLKNRRFRSAWRVAKRLENELADDARQTALYHVGRFAKSAFASQIPFDRFAADPDTAAFVAYLTASMNRRSAFTSGPQARAFDSVADKLLQAALAGNPQFDVIAYVFPRADVLAECDGRVLFGLLNKTVNLMTGTAGMMRSVAEASNMDLRTMVVRRGDDSSTWNALAGGWNKARDYWIALMVALGQAAVFDTFLPPKALRLMAADVAYGLHSGALHGDTGVCATLPRPWEVMPNVGGTPPLACTASMIVQACVAFGVNAEGSGWVKPRARREIAPFTPTPEMVHGIAVADPVFAQFLREIGVWSGKPLNWEKARAGMQV